MDILTVNWAAVVVAAIINMVLGMLWYGPFFGKAWMKMTGVSRDGMQNNPAAKSAMYRSMVIAFIIALVQNIVLAHLIVFSVAAAGIGGVQAGVWIAFFVWLGFVLPAHSGVYLWESKPIKLWAIYSGYYLVLLLINGALLGAWM